MHCITCILCILSADEEIFLCFANIDVFEMIHVSLFAYVGLKVDGVTPSCEDYLNDFRSSSFTQDDPNHSDEVHILRGIASDHWKAVTPSCIAPSCLKIKRCLLQTRTSPPPCLCFQPGWQWKTEADANLYNCSAKCLPLARSCSIWKSWLSDTSTTNILEEGKLELLEGTSEVVVNTESFPGMDFFILPLVLVRWVRTLFAAPYWCWPIKWFL